MKVLHQSELRGFHKLLLRGDGWGFVLIRDRVTHEGEWWIVRQDEGQWETTERTTIEAVRGELE